MMHMNGHCILKNCVFEDGREERRMLQAVQVVGGNC